MNYYQTKLHRLKLLLPTIFFILISYSLLLIAKKPVIGYELSIYSATPKIFWVAIIFGLFTGLFLVVSSLYSKSKMWILGMFTIIFCNFLVISLYGLRGYILYLARGDTLSYVGLAKDVSEFGIGSNFYPITSILISQLNQLAGISIITISKYLPSLFFIIYFLSIYCLSKSLLPDRKYALCSIIACMPIFYAWFSLTISHMYLSLSLIPLFIYILNRNSDYRFKIFCIIYSILFPLLHPLTSMLILIYLIVFFISEKLNFIQSRNISTSFILLSSISLISWFIQQPALHRNINIFFNMLKLLFKGELSSNNIQRLVNMLGYENIIRHLSFTISDEFIYYVLSLFVIFFVLRKNQIFAENFSKPSIYLLNSTFFTSLLFLTIWLRNPNRVLNLNFSIIITPTLVAYLLYTFYLKKRKWKTFLLLSLIFISSVVAIFSLYPSPITIQPNDYVTISDLNGMNWLITQKDTELKTAGILSPVFRYADLIYGKQFRLERKDLDRLRQGLYLPDHFGFTEDNLFPIDEDKYLVITEFDIRGFTEVWKDVDRFGKEDFIKVDFCTNVDKIYENGEFRSYLVHKYD